MPSRARCVVLLVWLCFVARGAFYGILLPLWEGFDEWAHFAYVQLLASGGGLPALGRTPISREVAESLSLTPLPRGHHELAVPWMTHDGWWKLPGSGRESRRRALLALPREWAAEPAGAAITNHEAQQPPFYYALMTPVQWIAGGAPLPTRVLLARLWSLLLASLSIPLVFLAGTRVFDSEAIAAGAAAVVASMPEFAMTAARVGNDGVAAAVFTALLWAVLSGQGPWAAGALLGVGLLTKAYFLTAVPALILIALTRPRRLRALGEAAAALAVAGAMAGWWYWRNHQLSGAWSGLQQVAAQSGLPLESLLAQIPKTDWVRFFDVAFLTHIWTGNWSFLQVRGWMYRVFAALALAAAAGLAVRLWRDRQARPRVAAPAAFYGCFWLGLCYHELTFSMLRLSSSAGWYVYAVVGAEVLLASLGWLALAGVRRAAGVLAAVSFLFVALDLYATHFLLLPYYTGLTAHRADGRLISFVAAQWAGGGWETMWSRLMAPAPFALAMWVVYLAATLALPAIVGLGVRSKLS